MDIPADILDKLKCSSCETYLSRGPVFLQHDGAAVCCRCYSPKRPATRNTQYEATAKLLKYPCKNRELGCPETVPFVQEAEVIAQEEVCEHRRFVCPVLGSARCDFLGPRAAMLAHCRDQHPDNVLENPCSLTHDITKGSLQNYIISAFHLLFLLHTRVCVTTGKIFHAVRLLEAAADAAKYTFHLDINRNDESVLKKGQVAPQGCLAIQEDTSLALDINCLLGVLGAFDDNMFTVTVKQRGSDAADQLAMVMEKCGRCKAEVTMVGDASAALPLGEPASRADRTPTSTSSAGNTRFISVSGAPRVAYAMRPCLEARCPRTTAQRTRTSRIQLAPRGGQLILKCRSVSCLVLQAPRCVNTIWTMLNLYSMCTLRYPVSG